MTRVGAKSESSFGTNSTGFPLLGKSVLALASLGGYVALALLAEHLAALGRSHEAGLLFHHAAGAVFGALVLATSPRI